MSAGGLQQVIVIPRNGYINRLQAWASASILAAELRVPSRLLWEPEPAAPGELASMLDIASLASTLVSGEEVTGLLGAAHASMSRYLTPLPERGVLVLAGHDRGEQVFIPALLELLRADSRLGTLVIIAGGQFHVPATADFDARRRAFYRDLRWSRALQARVDEELHERGQYLAVHVRQTDRSLTAPTARSLRAAVAGLRDQTNLSRLFVAADSSGARAQWHGIARELGMQPWSASDGPVERDSPHSALDAMLDWRLLGAATGLVYSSASSFGHEAATMIGVPERVIGLSAPVRQQRVRAAQQLARSAVRYPARRWGSGARRTQG